jgi:hypothetical protein
MVKHLLSMCEALPESLPEPAGPEHSGDTLSSSPTGALRRTVVTPTFHEKEPEAQGVEETLPWSHSQVQSGFLNYS